MVDAGGVDGAYSGQARGLAQEFQFRGIYCIFRMDDYFSGWDGQTRDVPRFPVNHAYAECRGN